MKDLTVAVCIHKPELEKFTRRIEFDCKKFGYHFYCYKQYGEANKSALVGRKECVRHCDTEFIWLVDADDQILELGFEPKHDITVFSALKSNGGRLVPNEPIHKSDDDMQNFIITYPPTWMRIFRTSLVRKSIETYPDFFAIDAEDTCFTYHAHKLTNDIEYRLDEYYYIYNTRTSSVCGIFDMEKVLAPFKYTEVYKYLPPIYKVDRDFVIVYRMIISPLFDKIKNKINDLDIETWPPEGGFPNYWQKKRYWELTNIYYLNRKEK